MSKPQIALLVALWIIALIPLGFSLVFVILFKLGLVTSPDTWTKGGMFAKLNRLLAGGGFLSLYAIAPGLGGGLALAGVWVGVLKMTSSLSGVGPWQVATMHWDQMLLIVLSATAVAMIGTTAMILYFGWDLPFGKGK